LASEIAAAFAGLVAGALGAFWGLRARRSARPVESRAAAAVPAASPVDSDATQRVLRALPFAAFLFDNEARVTYLNPSAESLFGTTAARSQGRVLIEVVPSVEFERQVKDALAGGSSTRDVRLIERDRERILGITVKSIDGQGVMAIAADRTELVSLERIRREFVSNVSHELRTPLAAIKLMIETMIDAQDDAEAREQFMPRVAAEVDRIVKLVEDLLAMARSESGRLIMRRERFDLTDVAATVIDTFSQRAATLDIDLDLEAPEPVYVDADRDRLTQVAINLVDNALRHTPGGGSVTVEVAVDDPWAVLRVRDTGAGIAHADLAHIFDRFYVADRSRSRGQSGTGLGLSIARNLVEAHGGTLAAESIFGRGATFTCRIPPAAGSADEETLRLLKVDLSQP
jgi:two-component system phosphate regulon sensor histidine kinase PhoR